MKLFANLASYWQSQMTCNHWLLSLERSQNSLVFFKDLCWSVCTFHTFSPTTVKGLQRPQNHVCLMKVLLFFIRRSAVVYKNLTLSFIASLNPSFRLWMWLNHHFPSHTTYGTYSVALSSYNDCICSKSVLNAINMLTLQQLGEAQLKIISPAVESQPKIKISEACHQGRVSCCVDIAKWWFSPHSFPRSLLLCEAETQWQNSCHFHLKKEMQSD